MSVAQHIITYGWDYAKGMVRDNPESDLIFMIKLKEYVRAYELVECYGGLGKANKLIDGSYIDSNHDIPRGHEELSMAIQLVEECL